MAAQPPTLGLLHDKSIIPRRGYGEIGPQFSWISPCRNPSQTFIHIIFSTKDRKPFFQGDFAQESHKLLAGITNRLECPAIEVGGVADHVHILARQSRTISLAEWVKELKRVSSIEIKENYAGLKRFQWQSGYAAFSVSQSNLESVRSYILGQESHHHRLTFQEELRLFLERHEVAFEEQYLWE